ncbi:ATP-dependent helicase [Paenibacillus zanthoxyli]|uniref:ATP-dependent helicase n=1 Tax=Paenibacillus zanthoxyli TaxID=369399 RepID=UPI001E439852|nr:ATP-dependent helicase [Paenibacillus zanthoxyli]
MNEMETAYKKKLAQIKKDQQQYDAFNSLENTAVLAGPGSGKTTVLTLKIMKLLSEIIKPPRGLACLTYSNEAAKEFKKRLKQLGLKERGNVFLGTVHSFCISEVITKFAHLFPQYNIPLPLKIISTKKKNQLFQRVREELNISENELSLTEMDSERSINIKGRSQVTIPSFDLALKAADLYERKLRASNYVDFSAIILYATQLIQNEEYVRRSLEAKFPWILIDEYQDLGKPLHEMILSLMDGTTSVFFAVGDPDQSIYGFNGAVPDYLLELSQLPSVRKIKLQTNYRSNQDIIDASEVALNPSSRRNYRAGTRGDERAQFSFKVCETDMIEQYNYVVSEVIPQNLEAGVPIEEIVILVGNKFQMKDLGEVLDRGGIPYYAAKHEFERTHVVAWLEDCANWLIDSEQNSFESIFLFWKSFLTRHGVDILGTDIILEKRKLYDLLKRSLFGNEQLVDWIQCVLKNTRLRELLKNTEVYPDENENLDNLLKVAKEGKFAGFTLEQFSQLGKPVNQVTISTRHSSKGLEFETIVLLGMEEGNFPSYRSTTERKIKEEYRIFFVCVSRAKSRCYLVRSKVQRGWKKKPSRFWTNLYDWNIQRSK